MEILGVELPDWDDELGTPIDILMVVKALKGESDPSSGSCAYRLVIRSSGISAWEAAGMAKWIEHIAFDFDDFDEEEDDDDEAA
jgi:hypothetical protein